MKKKREKHAFIRIKNKIMENMFFKQHASHDRMIIEYVKSVMQFAGEYFGNVLHLFTFYFNQSNLCSK